MSLHVCVREYCFFFSVSESVVGIVSCFLLLLFLTDGDELTKVNTVMSLMVMTMTLLTLTVMDITPTVITMFLMMTIVTKIKLMTMTMTLMNTTTMKITLMK